MEHPIINNAGYYKLEYIVQRSVTAIAINPATGLVTGITLAEGTVWTELYSSKNDINMEMENPVDDNGLFKKVKVGGFLPGNTPETNSIIKPLVVNPFEKFLLKLTDLNENVTLLGSLTEGLSFAEKSNQGGHPGTNVGHNYGFEGDLLVNSVRFLA